jgi:tRNA nucleotidyltransferase/poly(A) polymerase
VVQYRTHTTETLNYLADYLEEFHATKDVFTTYQMSKATDSIAHARMKDLKMQLKAEHAIEDEETGEWGQALSHAQKEHRKAEVKKRLQEVYNSKVHEPTSFDFVKIHRMLHYEESVQRFGHLVKDSTETQEMNHPKMCIGHYRQSNRNFRYKRQILNDYSRIHVLRMRCLHLRQLPKEGHWTPKIQEALQLYQRKDQIVVNKCNREQVPIPENLPLSFREDEGNIQVRVLRSPRRKGFFVKNERLPMYKFPLVEYI